MEWGSDNWEFPPPQPEAAQEFAPPSVAGGAALRKRKVTADAGTHGQHGGPAVQAQGHAERRSGRQRSSPAAAGCGSAGQGAQAAVGGACDQAGSRPHKGAGCITAHAHLARGS